MLWVRFAKLGTFIAAITLMVFVVDRFRYIRNDDWFAVAGIAALIIINFIALNSSARGGSWLATKMQRKRMEELRKIKEIETELGDWQPAYMQTKPGLIRRCIRAIMAPSVAREEGIGKGGPV